MVWLTASSTGLTQKSKVLFSSIEAALIKVTTNLIQSVTSTQVNERPKANASNLVGKERRTQERMVARSSQLVATVSFSLR